MSKVIVMQYDKKTDSFVKKIEENLDEKIDDFVQDIIEYRNELIIENKKNREKMTLTKNKEMALKQIQLDKEIIAPPGFIKRYKCECGIILKRLDGMARHQKTKKHENLMALKVLKEQMEKLSTKNPPLGPVATKAPSMGGEISYISVEKSKKQ